MLSAMISSSALKLEAITLIDRFFDADCISCFMCVNSEHLLSELYVNQVKIPSQVYDELSRVPRFKPRLDRMIVDHEVMIESMLAGTEEAFDYEEFISFPRPGFKLLGNGESACIAMAKNRGGIVASNNLKDIDRYIRQYGLNLLTTADIIAHAYKTGSIEKQKADTMWQDMHAQNRKLPTNTFDRYIELGP